MDINNDTTTELAESILRECWDEFYESYLPQYITASSRILYPESGKVNLMDEELDQTVFDTPAKNELLNLNPQPSHFVSYFDETELDLDDGLIEPDSQTAEVWEELELPNPVPSYTAYTPIQHSAYFRGDLWVDEDDAEFRLLAKAQIATKSDRKKILADRDKIRKGRIANAETRGNVGYSQETLFFIPPEVWDMPHGDLEDYLDNFHDIEAWRDSRMHWDNNEDIIEAATLQRLLFAHNLTPKAIDQTRVLSQKVKQLCKVLQNRTYPNLDEIYRQNALLPPLPLDELLNPHITPTPLHMAIDAARTQCHHPDCYSYWPCKVHYQTFHRATRKNPGKRGIGPLYPKFSTPKLKVSQLIAQAKRENSSECDNDCFLSLVAAPQTADDSNDEIVVHDEGDDLSENAQAELELNWKQLPDATPCDIAIFGGGSYTCRQAYQMRNKLFPDTGLESDESEIEQEKKRGKQKPIGLKNASMMGHVRGTQSVPASNRNAFAYGIAGVTRPADNGKQAARALGLRVPTSVEQINVNAQLNDGNVIPNYARGAEQNGAPCRNTQLLLQKYKETKVKPSKYGFGLFLVSERAVKGDLIAEYTGEIIHERTVARRIPIYNKTNRNYLFNVDSDGIQYTIDAAIAGNESRFINHPYRGKRANCRAIWRYVGGVLRLGIYADRHIFKNEELFLNYGKDFFFSPPPPKADSMPEQHETTGTSDGTEELDDIEVDMEVSEGYEDEVQESTSSSSLEL